jgi:hypothetical protein
VCYDSDEERELVIKKEKEKICERKKKQREKVCHCVVMPPSVERTRMTTPATMASPETSTIKTIEMTTTTTASIMGKHKGCDLSYDSEYEIHINKLTQTYFHNHFFDDQI